MEVKIDNTYNMMMTKMIIMMRMIMMMIMMIMIIIAVIQSIFKLGPPNFAGNYIQMIPTI